MWVHPAIVEVALLAGASITVRKRLFVRAFAGGDPLTLVAQSLVHCVARLLSLEVIVHHGRLCPRAIRILVFVDAKVERYTRLFALRLRRREAVANRDVIRLVVLFVEAAPFEFGAMIEVHVPHARGTSLFGGRLRR